ncbi:MAG: rRNA maturation RNase YbeY [Verrucomicrobia bacterium]|nr:rRNA maturation RNase YbeY [Verrucomicrobiota bacterium]
MLISDPQTALDLDPESIRALVDFVLDAEGAPEAIETSIVFVDDAAIAELNVRHLGHDGPTDVLAFPLDEAPPRFAVNEHADTDPALDQPALLGDVVVSTERAIAYCRDHGGDPIEETAVYLVHGLLHLLGYDDLTGSEYVRMHGRQAELLRHAAESGIVLRGRVVHTEPGCQGPGA